jgi:hypothetical protein
LYQEDVVTELKRKRLEQIVWCGTKEKTKLTEGYNLINGAKLWYQMIRTP